MHVQRNFVRGRRVTGTLNNPTLEERTHFVELCTDDGRSRLVKYLVFQSEVGSQGVVHLQFYCIFTESVRARQAHRVLGPRVHFDASRGSAIQNTHYCLKPHDQCVCDHCTAARLLPNDGREAMPGFITGTWGRMRAPRGPDKLTAVMEMMEPMEHSIGEILDAHPVSAVKYGDRIRKEYQRRVMPRSWAMDIRIFVGETGSGKTFTAKSENPDSITIPWPTGGRWWWPGYDGQECVILDDFRSGNITVLTMMKLFDRGEWWVEAKGTNSQFVSRKIVVTTNVDPKDWFQMFKLVLNKGQQARKLILEPLARRIREYAKIYDFAGGNVFPNFVKVERVERFEFNDSDVPDLGGNIDGGSRQYGGDLG